MRKRALLLFGFFLGMLVLRLSFAFQSQSFSDDQAYFTLRQITHILQHGIPFFNDPLSFGGREHFFSPVFYYILAFFGLFIPTELVLKIMPNFLILLLIPSTFLLAYELTKDKNAAFAAALVSAFIPVLFRTTLNDASPYSFLIPLSFFLFYCYLKAAKLPFFFLYFSALLLISLEPVIPLLFLPFFALYWLLRKMEHERMEKREQGILLLSVFCILLLQFLLYQKAFLLHGIATIWQNIPSQLLAKYFQDITILEVIYQIGSLPFFYGIYAIYTTVFGERMSREFTLLLALTLSMVLLLWLKFIQIAVGLAYLGVVMSILFAQFTKVTTQYIEKTTFWYVKPGLYLILIPLFLLANVYPALLFGRQTLYTSFSPGTLEAMEWIRQHTEEDATIMATDTEGHLITGLANRKNVLDNNFLFIPDAEQRYAAMLEIYTTTDKRRAIQLLNAYNVTYLLFSPTAQEKFHALSLPYYDPYCLKPEYYEAIKIYKVQCVVE